MWSYAMKLGLAAIAFLVAGIIAILIFDRIWFRVGFGAALAVVVGGLLFLAWRVDRKAKQSREGLERI